MNIFRQNIKLFIGLFLGIISCLSVYAISADQITYNNTTVDSALDDLYSNITSDLILDNLTPSTEGIHFEGDYYYIYIPKRVSWNNEYMSGMNNEKIIFCHKTSGNNGNFTATLPFSLDGKNLQVKLIRQIGNSGWSPRIMQADGNYLDIDVNYGTPELSEYYFYVEIK